MSDCPFAKHIVTKRNPISSKIAQGFTANQGIDRGRGVIGDAQRLLSQEGLLGEREEQPCAVSVAAVSSSVRALPPLLSHIDLSAGNRLGCGNTRQACQSVQVATDIPRRMARGQQSRQTRSGISQLRYL